MKKAVAIITAAILSLMLLSSCGRSGTEGNDGNNKIGVNDLKIDENCVVGADYPELLQAQAPAAGDTVVTIETTLGSISAILYADKAPKAVENFITHAKNGYYDGVVFHRIIPSFMIQTGDPTGTGNGGESIWGGKFETELPEGLYHFRGALAMARTNQMNTNGSQFYIVQNPSVASAQNTATGTAKEVYSEFGGYPYLDGKYTVFGQVFAGLDVVDAIAAKGSTSGSPTEKIYINKITVSQIEE